MASSGWETFGNVLGGGIDRAGAFETGWLRTAQTESALQLARERQLSNVAAEKKAKALDEADAAMAAAGIDPKQARLLQNIAIGEYGSDFSAGTTGLLNQQEMGFRDVLANPEAPLGAQFAAGQGVKGEVLPRYKVEGGVAQDLLSEDLGLFATPVGESTIDANEALVNLRNTQAGDPDYVTISGSGGGSGHGGYKAPSGYKVNPAYDPNLPPGPDNRELLPLTGGPADNEFGGAPLGSIERRFLRRVTGAAENTIDDLEVFLSMPSGISVGRFGGTAGMKNEDKLIGALMYQAKYQMTPEDENMYNSALGGFSEQLRVMEAQGLRGAAATAAQFDALRFEPKDSQWTRMFKLSRVRQTVENGIVPNLAAANLPTSERQYMESLIQRVQTSIPFTPQDVMAWRAAQQRNPSVTLGEVVDDRIAAGGGTPRVDASRSTTSGGTSTPVEDAGWIDLGNGVRVREKRGP